MDSKVKKDSLRRKSSSQKEQARHSRGMMFLEAAMLLPMAAVVTVGLAYYANAYVTKTRLGDSARVIARAIQDDPGITQGSLTGALGELDQVVSEATGVGDDLPAGFNVATYKSCNPDLAAWSDDNARKHFARAGRYENRRGVFGNCGVHSDVGARDARVSITSSPTKPSASQITALIPPNGGVLNGIHGSGRFHTYGQFYGHKYQNPNSNPSKPYWVSVVAKKPVRQFSIFGWTFGTLPEIVNYSSVRVVPDPNSVTLFQHCTSDTADGFAATIKPGRYSSMAELGLTDNSLSSLRISPGTQVTLYDGENFTGNSITLTEDAGCLNASTPNFNDLTSSLVVERTPPSSEILGEPLFAKYTTPFDSSPGRGWTNWNSDLRAYFQTRSDWLPATRQGWEDACFSPSPGLTPPSFTNNQIAFEYCGRFACFKEFGVWPFMARLTDTCPNGGPSDCNGGKFYIGWVCLNKAPQ
jgi:hypothetical protein